jgi:hypothetical protein
LIFLSGEIIKAEFTSIKIGLVGPCTAGKTTLAAKLIPLGYNIRQIAQEHSYVPYMWKRITNPDLLIFLNVSFNVSQKRKNLNWNESEYNEQQKRLNHARSNAHLYIDTDPLTPDQVMETVLEFLSGLRLIGNYRGGALDTSTGNPE